MKRLRSRMGVAAGTLVLAGAAVGLVTTSPVGADDAPGSGFQTFSVSAVAGGQRILASKAANQAPGTVDSGVPDAEATLSASASHALSSIAWPSALAGNAGTLLFLLGPYPCSPGAYNPPLPTVQPQCSPAPVPPDVMDQYHFLNSPIRAEAINPGNGAQDNSVPGATMSARAENAEAAAEAVIGAQLFTDVEKVSSTKATSLVRATGPTTAVADARSTVTDISFANGLITIGAVVSSAHAETTGVSAVSSGTTTVTDMKIGNVPVFVDRDGVHVNTQNVNAVKPLTDAVNQILTNFTMKMFLTRPTQSVKGSTTTYDAGSLIIEGPGPFTFEFGGAHVTAGSTLPFEFEFDDTAAGGDTLGAPSFLSSDGSFSSFAPDVAGASFGVPVAGRATPRTGRAPVLNPQLASTPAALPSGISAWWVVFAVLGALALAGGLRRLPDRLLDAAGATCEEGG